MTDLLKCYYDQAGKKCSLAMAYINDGALFSAARVLRSLANELDKRARARDAYRHKRIAAEGDAL